MGQIAWDYSNARIHGKNVFFFRDTSHISPVIQERIYQALDSTLTQKLFNTVFVEGISAVVSPDELDDAASEEDLMQKAMDKAGRPLGADELLAYRHSSKMKSGELYIVGSERKGLNEKHGSILREISVLTEGCGDRFPTLLEYAKHLFLSQREVTLCRRRGLWAAQNVIDYMNSKGLETAALVMGEGHFEEITEHFKRNGLGYVSFFPGEAITDSRASRNYSKKI
jgi:hypothetical protein